MMNRPHSNFYFETVLGGQSRRHAGFPAIETGAPSQPLSGAGASVINFGRGRKLESEGDSVEASTVTETKLQRFISVARTVFDVVAAVSFLVVTAGAILGAFFILLFG